MRKLILALLACRPLLHMLEAQSPPAVTKETVDSWMKQLSNWGRWGAEDELGTINLITPAKRRQAAALVKDGFTVSLARDVIKQKAADVSSPFLHLMTMTGMNNPGPP